MDLPTYLVGADMLTKAEGKCEHCHREALAGMYEQDTDAVYDVFCTNCQWSDADGCAGPRCLYENCPDSQMSLCCGDPITDYGLCGACGDHC